LCFTQRIVQSLFKSIGKGECEDRPEWVFSGD